MTLFTLRSGMLRSHFRGTMNAPIVRHQTSSPRLRIMITQTSSLIGRRLAEASFRRAGWLRSVWFVALLPPILSAGAPKLSAAPPAQDGETFFERNIRPILV